MKPKIDILYCLGGVYNGGQERQLFYLMNAIDKSKVKIGLAIWRSDDSNTLALSRFEGLKIPIFKLKGSTLGRIYQLRKIVVRHKIALCHSYTFYINSAIWAACLTTGTKAVGGLRSSFGYFKFSAGKLNGIICGLLPLSNITNNYKGAEELEKAYSKIVKRKIYTLTNGIDLDKFEASPPKINNEINICAIGRLGPEKRWDILIDLIYELINKNYAIRLKLAGNGELKSQLQSLIKSRSLEKHIELIGEVENVNRLLLWSHLLIHTAESEGASNVIIEAMASGRAVLATSAGDAKWLIEEEISGIVVPINDKAALVKRATELLDDPSKLIRMGRLGRLKAEKKFALNDMVKRAFIIYEKEGVSFDHQVTKKTNAHSFNFTSTELK